MSAKGTTRRLSTETPQSAVPFARNGSQRNRGMAVWVGLVTATLLGAAALLAGATRSQAVGPYPSLGSCQVFPDPPASLSPRAPSLATEAAWNQDISKAPRDP